MHCYREERDRERIEALPASWPPRTFEDEAWILALLDVSDGEDQS